ncbi:MAG: 16S rRNA pseudouridine(516) synthase, partial [Coprococcus sp.]
KDRLQCGGRDVVYQTHVYYMLNKPSGVITATNDKRQKTVLDLITDKERKDLFPVGRLDKDTEGLLLITNNGELAHQLLSPKKHVSKLYRALVEGCVTDEDVRLFAEGLKMDEEWTALPAELKILSAGPESEVEVIIYEGKFHQIKRMFEAVGKKVVALKRLSMGTLQLDGSLQPGEYRPLTTDELEQLTALTDHMDTKG